MDHQNDRKMVAAAANTNQRQQKTQPRSILAEEEYTDTLTHIVTRDYFPAIHSLRRDNAILEARSRGDIASAVTSRRQFRKEETERKREWEENMQEEGEAAAGTTELAHHFGNRAINIRKRPRPLKHESVTGFHARVTSEDNAEFDMNQQREQRDLEAKMAVIYSATANKTGRLMIESTLSQQHIEDAGYDNIDNQDSLLSDNLGLASDKFDPTPSGIRIIDGKESSSTQGISKNGLFFEPRHQKQIAPASNSDHLLMPPPPARDPNPTSSIIPFQQSKDQPPTKDASAYSSSSKQLHELVEYIPKSTEPNINPPATRFPYQNESRLLPNNCHNSNDIRRSNSHSSDTSASESTDLDATPRSLQRERAAYQQAKVRENETFVAMTPLIRPGGSDGRNDGETGAAAEPIMTWGNVASTPLVLGGGSSADGIYNNSAEWEPSPLLAIDTGNSDVSDNPTFDVVDESSREALAQNAEKMLMDRAKKYSATGSSGKRKRAYAPKSKSGQANSLDRSASLTPAARALLQANKRDPSSSIFQSSNGSRKSNARSKDSFGSALRTAYTPTPQRGREGSRRRNSATPAMLRAAAAAAGATPRLDKSGQRG